VSVESSWLIFRRDLEDLEEKLVDSGAELRRELDVP